MEHHDNPHHSNDFFKEFEKKDKFFNSFKEEFALEIYSIITEHYGKCEYSESLKNTITMFANDIINTAESVIDKDDNYPEYRKQIELEDITKLMNRVLDMIDNDPFLNAIHHKTKELVSHHYPQIINLSNYGFRLLERNTKLYSGSFLINLMQKQIIPTN